MRDKTHIATDIRGYAQRVGRWDENGDIYHRCPECSALTDNEWVAIPVHNGYITGEIRVCMDSKCLRKARRNLNNGKTRLGIPQFDNPGNSTAAYREMVLGELFLEVRDSDENAPATPTRSIEGQGAPQTRSLSVQYPESSHTAMSREDIVSALIEESGMVCQGCYRVFDDPLYLELDHIRPRSDGGEDHIANRVLLCGPCNRIKSNKLTLSGLQDHNIKAGRMMAQPAHDKAIPLPQSLNLLEQGELT